MKAPASAADKRSAQRIRVLSHVKAIGPGIYRDCVVRDLSETGAKISIPRSIKLPSEFLLHFTRHDLHVRVRLRWRRKDEAGVSFVLREQFAQVIEANRKSAFILNA